MLTEVHVQKVVRFFVFFPHEGHGDLHQGLKASLLGDFLYLYPLEEREQVLECRLLGSSPEGN